MKTRLENDTLGKVKIPLDKYWGPQTQRSLNNFKIGPEKSMPIEIIYAYGYIKKACAIVNYDLKKISKKKSQLICKVCDEIIKGKLNDHFPLVVWQTGSGTQTNMNVNEVISNRSHILLGKKLSIGEKLIHPNNDANKSQSSNDTFPTAMHISAYKILLEETIPNIEILKNTFNSKSKEFKDIIKIGRTHWMDATPISLGQEISSFTAQLENGLDSLKKILPRISELAIGGTAVGTGINSPKHFDKLVTKHISKLTGYKFKPAKNKFELISSHDTLVNAHGVIKLIAVSLIKIANDIRILSSGPRSGIGEISIPANEPGSSIMPGKVNPTQVEALVMVCTQILGNDTTISIAGSNGSFQLNTYKPLIINTFLQSAKLISDACLSFNNYCAIGIKPNKQRIKMHLDNSLMLVTCLNDHIGYESSAKIAKKAFKENTTLKEAAIKLKLLTNEEFDKLVDVKRMI